MNPASAYETHALEFLDARDKSPAGASIVASWARALPVGTDVIEIACGGGYPVTQTLVETGVNLWAIDPSPTLLERFRLRFPSIPTQCALASEVITLGVNSARPYLSDCSFSWMHPSKQLKLWRTLDFASLALMSMKARTTTMKHRR